MAQFKVKNDTVDTEHSTKSHEMASNTKSPNVRQSRELKGQVQWIGEVQSTSVVTIGHSSTVERRLTTSLEAVVKGLAVLVMLLGFAQFVAVSVFGTILYQPLYYALGIAIGIGVVATVIDQYSDIFR